MGVKLRMRRRLFASHQPSPALLARFVRVLRAMLWFGVAAFGSYLGLFLWLGVPGMPLVNVGMVTICLLSLVLLGRGHVNLSLAVGASMVLVHSLCVTWLLGWDAGFHLYAFLMLCMLLLSPSIAGITKLVIYIGLTAAYAYAWWHLSGATIDGMTGLFGLANVIVFAALLGVLSAIYSSGFTQTADEFAARNAELAHQATTDPLTGLYNRRHLLDVLQQETARYLRTGRQFAVIVGDIDNFKAINDRHGHQCGDAVIVAVARVLHDAVRTPDLVARWGGEEFLVFLPETALDEALGVAARIQAQLAAAPLAHGSLRLEVCMTLGVAPMLTDGSVERLLQRADEALYRGKRGGRNRIEVISDAVAA